MNIETASVPTNGAHEPTPEDTREPAQVRLIPDAPPAKAPDPTPTVSEEKPGEEGGERKRKPYPAASFEESLTLANGMWAFSAGEKARRQSLFDEHFKRSADSGPSRQLVTNSSKYGITNGSYKATHIEFTPKGRTATSPDADPLDQMKARFELAITGIDPFRQLYEFTKDKKMPAPAALRDFLKDQGFNEADATECIGLFTTNAKFVGLLRTSAGAERMYSIEHLLEEKARTMPRGTKDPRMATATPAALTSETDWDHVCFYMTPIGEPGSEQRLHSDLFLGSIVEPALEEFGIRVVRADQIDKPGMITRQIADHVLNARLVIVDLSFHNPNAFYELALRHATGLPTIQIIRSGDKIPFDVDQVRTVKIDTTSIYTLVPQIDTYRSEIAAQVKRALEDPDSLDNPLTIFAPGYKLVNVNKR